MWKVTATNAPMVIVGASSVIAFSVGALGGHILTKNVLKAKYEALVEEEVQNAKAYFSMRNKTGAYNDPAKVVAAKIGEETVEYEDISDPYRTVSVEVAKDDVKRTSKPAPDEGMEAFEKRLIREAKEEVDDVKERLGIFDEESEEDESEEEVITMNVFSDNSSESDERNPNKPFILTQREFEEGEHDYTQNTLTYYEGDDVLTDERDQPIHHLQKIVGVENLLFGEQSNDPNIVYIRNNHLEVDFEVCRSTGTFAEEVLGYTEPSNKQRPRKFREYD